MKDKERQVVEESIAHWKRMIDWVQTQPKNDKPSLRTMTTFIREYWTGECCSLCQYAGRNLGRTYCENCPLYAKGHECLASDSLWCRVDTSDSWGEWLENARVMLKTLEEL